VVSQSNYYVVSLCYYYLMQGADLKCMRADIWRRCQAYSKGQKACSWICSC